MNGMAGSGMLRAMHRSEPIRPDAKRAIERACRLIETSEPAPSLATLAREVGLSPAHFQRLFVAAVGVSPKAYGTTLRRKRLVDALDGATRVADAIFDAGYTASSVAYRDSAALGMKPSSLRRGGHGERIRHASIPCSLGSLFIAATDQGLCAVEFTDVASGEEDLRRRFPGARIGPGDARLQGWLRAILGMIDGSEPRTELPLDIRGTAFQTKVWKALQRIPAGRTVSYGELARRIGAPRSVRAVARACAQNSIAVVVPCHRVIGSSGKLTGYRWGIDRKRALIDREAAAAQKPAPRRRTATQPR
jgi:AraC family transcriptional regulator, regulatory protein of adaptative response / methylated-DNA-[protein]-cysteine methyltransferase